MTEQWTAKQDPDLGAKWVVVRPGLGWVAHSLSEQEARLIAAAPDLLAAIKSLVSDILEYEEINNLAANPGYKDCWQSVTQARAAIAKAEGASPTSPVETPNG